jgi:hypothetical protein
LLDAWRRTERRSGTPPTVRRSSGPCNWPADRAIDPKGAVPQAPGSASPMSPRRFLWLALCFFLGIAGGFLTAEIIGLPLALILPIALVLVARHRGQGMATLLSYSAGFELLALWVGLPAVLPSSWATPAHPSQTLLLAGLMLVLGIAMGAAAFLPAVRGKR